MTGVSYRDLILLTNSQTHPRADKAAAERLTGRNKHMRISDGRDSDIAWSEGIGRTILASHGTGRSPQNDYTVSVLQ